MGYFPFYFLKVRLWKKDKLYIKERLGLKLPKISWSGPSLWIHAVSVGEVLSLQNLVQEIKKRYPGWKIHFSTLTNSGMKMAREKLPLVDSFSFLPLDFAWVIRRFFRAYQPQVLVLAESEFWPNLLRIAKKKTKAVILINGRISDRSYRRFQRVKPVVRKILGKVSLFLVQTERERERLEELGIDSNLIQVTGNLKSEVRLPSYTEIEMEKIKEALNIAEPRKIVVAGSTRKGEEEVILEAFSIARKDRPHVLLILVPRHPERAEEVERLAKDFGFSVARRTRLQKNSSWDVLIVDTLGELPQYYALSDIAFVGGSLTSWGGHNLLEPAFYKKPICFGPHMENFSALAETFLSSQAARVVSSARELGELFSLKDEKELKEMGARAYEALLSLEGATERTLSAIASFMNE